MRPTEGPSQNILLLETGEIQIGFVTQGVALQAWNSGGVATGGRPVRAMRAMFPMYDTPFQFVARIRAFSRLPILVEGVESGRREAPGDICTEVVSNVGNRRTTRSR